MKFNQCLSCKNVFDDKFSCKAFPNGIPYEVRTNQFIHSHPYSGDNGIMFEPSVDADTLGYADILKVEPRTG